MAAPTVLIRNIHHGVCKDEERDGRGKKEPVARSYGKLAAPMSSPRGERESADDVGNRMIRGEKGRRRNVSHLSSVVTEKDSDGDGVGRGTAECGGWLEMNRFTHRE